MFNSVQPQGSEPAPSAAPASAPQQPYFQRRRSPVTPEMMAETGGLLELKMHQTGVGDPTRQIPKKGKAKGRVPRNQNDSSTRNWTRQISGRRNFAGVLPPELLTKIREAANRIESEERIIARHCRDFHASMPQLFTAVAIIAPTLRKLLAEQSVFWEAVPNRPRRKGACLSLDDPDYLAWATKGSEIVTFVADTLKALTPALCISLEIAIAHTKRTGSAPSAEQLAELTLSQAVADLRSAGTLGAETDHVQHLAQSGQTEPIALPDDWTPTSLLGGPVFQDIAREKERTFEAARAKATAVAQAHEASESAATHSPEPERRPLDSLLTVPVPLTADIIPRHTPEQLTARAMFLSGLDRASVAAETYAQLASEHTTLARRHSLIAT